MDWLTQALDPAHISALFAQFQEEMRSPTFWVAVTKIIWINVLLSGDNALVIAMAGGFSTVLLLSSGCYAVAAVCIYLHEARAAREAR